MMPKNNQIYFTASLFIMMFVGHFFITPTVRAQVEASQTSSWRLACYQQTQDCVLENSSGDKFFNEKNLQPGEMRQRQFVVSNQTQGNCFLELEASPEESNLDYGLATVINTSIYSAQKIWFNSFVDLDQLSDTQQSLTLADLYAAGPVKLGKLRPNQERSYYWLAAIDKWRADNSWQGTKTQFDISFHVKCLAKEESSSTMNSPISTGQVKGVTTQNRALQFDRPAVVLVLDTILTTVWLIWLL